MKFIYLLYEITYDLVSRPPVEFANYRVLITSQNICQIIAAWSNKSENILYIILFIFCLA